MANTEMRYCEFCKRETLFLLMDGWRCDECGGYFDSEEDSEGNRCLHCGEELDEDYEIGYEKEYNDVMKMISDKDDYPTLKNQLNNRDISFEEFSEKEIIALCRYAIDKENGNFFLAMGDCHKEVISTHFKSLSVEKK